MYIETDAAGRVVGTSEGELDGWEQADVPEGFDFAHQADYVLDGGELVYSPQQPDGETVAAQALAARQGQLGAAIAAVLETALPSLTDGQAAAVSTLVPEWDAGGAAYTVGQVVRHGGALWRCIQDNASSGTWVPSRYTSAWKRIGEPDESGYYPWVQPLGATDAYAKGNAVTHNGQLWESAIDSNVWEPGAYGWVEKASDNSDGNDDNSDNGASDVPEWVQPTGAHDAYAKGAKVRHNGSLWVSSADSNVWEPGAYGWEQQEG